MVKECVKKCSSCGHDGHNARSCGGADKKQKEISLKLFGFKIHVPHKHESASSDTSASESAMRKCKSAPNLLACGGDPVDAGYLSDEPREKRRGVPWTEEEHLSFLNGLEKLGKGNWKGISKKYVQSRSPIQVASHAQKYFNRLNLRDRRNKRSSLFDLYLKDPEIKNPPPSQPLQTTNEEIPKLTDNLPTLSLKQSDVNEEQADTFEKALTTPLAAHPVLPYAPCYGVPNFNQMHYMPVMGMTNNGQIFPGAKSLPSMPAVPVMFIPNPIYFYPPKSPEYHQA